MFCDRATLLGSELLLSPWLLWVVLPIPRLLSAQSVLACPKSAQRRPLERVRGLTGKLHEEWLRSPGVFSLERKRQIRPHWGLQLPQEGQL